MALPAARRPRNAKISEIAATTFGSLEAYGFHGLEVIQCLAERRAGGETGVRSVQMLTGDQILKAARTGVFNRKLLETALRHRRHFLPPPVHGAIAANWALKATW